MELVGSCKTREKAPEDETSARLRQQFNSAQLDLTGPEPAIYALIRSFQRGRDPLRVSGPVRIPLPPGLQPFANHISLSSHARLCLGDLFLCTVHY